MKKALILLVVLVLLAGLLFGLYHFLWTADNFAALGEKAMKSGNYAYVGRKQKKRDFRSLWITRISAQAKVNGINYSQFMHGLKKSGIDLNRKMLAELAVSDKEAFAELAEKAKSAL